MPVGIPEKPGKATRHWATDRPSIGCHREREPNASGKLDKRFGAAQLEPGRMGELVDLISTIGFGEGKKSGDVWEVYEYFLGQFASAEGKKGGQFYTPAHVVKTLVAVLAPHKGRVYDPAVDRAACSSRASGSSKVTADGVMTSPSMGRRATQPPEVGSDEPGNRGLLLTLTGTRHLARDQHPDQKFDYILANPPFNVSDWGGEKYDMTPLTFGRPPVGMPTTPVTAHALETSPWW